MRKNISNRHIILIILLFLTSCKSVYNTNYSKFDKNGINTQNINPLKFDFNGFVVSDNKKYRIGGKVEIDEDSSVYMQIKSSTLGIEVCRLKLFNDSLIFINRFEKKAYKGTIKNSVIKYNIVDKNLIGLLTANIVKIEGNSYKTEQRDSIIKLIYADKSVNQSIKIDKKNNIIEQKISQNGEKIVFNYHKLKRNELPQIVDFKIDNKNINVSGTLNYTNIKKLKDKIKNITLPKNYTLY